MIEACSGEVAEMVLGLSVLVMVVVVLVWVMMTFGDYASGDIVMDGDIVMAVATSRWLRRCCDEDKYSAVVPPWWR